MTNSDVPASFEEAEKWFLENSKKEAFISDFGGDIDGGGVFAGTLLQWAFGNEYNPEIVQAITAKYPGAWSRKRAAL
ncbi:hypothetical protein [Acidomonas methanolica]|uniref:Uncharacterized protein n=1 Tax=Acidomonas methanolica NBRC 104435 TaxID=1231351 RepID=A0A023D7J2_ACIMT|nr:hypothetical protein [Acidomonas methanolica]TCS24107.1 hypothetical protein EDC31_12528 [Acidomonas methanolica]GAJ29741.1 hypothetical protein Amme_076_034 [Acidomonas methanolica NBRC 104435]GBQ59415.1 hypothetical protein AA0498_2747 [Acidomonas methanolica]GEL00022.1 hypothetical protein AME01nite_25200 [Acidomonas methanolica NBRC 104435]